MRSEELIKACRDYGHNAGLLSETFKTMYFAEPRSSRAIEFDRPDGCWIVSLVEVREAHVLFETVLLTTERRAEADDMLKAIDAPEFRGVVDL